MMQPKVVGALYDREKKPADEPNFRSPYYREIAKYKHILSCTWKNGEKREASEPTEPLVSKVSNPIEDDLGLIFKLKGKQVRDGRKTDKPELDDPERDDNGDEEVDTPSKGPALPKARASTSKFMATVAARYLQYTEHERKTINLTLEGIRSAPFYNICMPIHGFHPYYQAEQIYQGEVEVEELINVFFVRFLSTMSPSGDKSKRNTVAQIKLVKSWLENNDRALAAVLHEIAEAKHIAWCFFYTTKALEMKLGRAQFTVDDASHIAVIDQAEIELMSPIET
jgi:hypothetical protein